MTPNGIISSLPKVQFIQYLLIFFLDSFKVVFKNVNIQQEKRRFIMHINVII